MLRLNGNFVFDLCDIFQECNPGTKWDTHARAR